MATATADGNVVEDEADRELEKLQGAVNKLATKESISEDSLRRLDRQTYKSEEAVDALQIEGIPEERIHQRRTRLLALRRAIDAAKRNLDRKSVMSTRFEDLPKGHAGSYRGTEDPTQARLTYSCEFKPAFRPYSSGMPSPISPSNQYLGGTKIIARETEEIGRNTLREMHQQQGKAEKIVEHFDSIESNLQRARSVVKQIARGAANDRCVQVLCFFIGIATLVIIILKATGGSDNLLQEEGQPAVVAL
ncbi:hypothetical protein FOL47_007506 [Perkinsus chesapeaki]|uniref:t-SNARE coiled-coil homology domain-containing protein n=1 Tax=Perkinsus chesapeaki TaxID=330153 RepID=A0A7J6LK16_PERCH|nr:hypothetical protein FOL47_007506 [Perkinsus chesapeaki]